jgi:predicted RND superfamily exporter protein
MARIEKILGDLIVKHRWWIIAATLIAVTVAASGTAFLTFNNDNRVFFSEENPQLKALEALENVYSKNQNIFFAIAPHNKEVFSRETLSLLEALTEQAWQIPYSSRVDSITNFQHTMAEDDDLIVADLVENAAAMTARELESVRATALSEPLLVNRLISSSGQVAGVNVNILLPGKSTAEIPEATVYARTLVKNFGVAYPGVKIYLTGGVIMGNGFGEASRDDMTTLVPLMFISLVVIAGIALRSLTGTLTTVLTIIFSMLTGLGIAGWLNISMTTASVNAPTLIMTLAVADSIHILVTLFQQMRRGLSKQAAIKRSIQVNLQPVFLTSLTTAIGFLSMNFSDAPPFRDLGNMVAIGIAAAFGLSLFFLPALMSVLPVKVAVSRQKSRGFNSRLADVVIKHRKPVFWGTLILMAAMTAGITRIQLNDDWVKYFDKRYDFRVATDFVQENLSGWDAIEYSLASGETGGISDPGYLRTVEAFANWYRRQPKVVHVNSITDTMKRLNKNMHGDDASFYRIPQSRELAAQYLLLYEMSLPFGLDLNDRINVEKSATRLIVTLNNTNTRELRQMDENARAWLKVNAPENMYTYGSGLSVIWAHISQRNIDSMLKAAFGALILISAILIIALKDTRMGIASLIPNLAPAAMGFGLWGYLSGQVGLGLSVVAAMTLGIVVDDTIHFLSKYVRARRERGLSPQEAVRYAFRTVGTALWITTIALVAGFLVLSGSGFKMNADMGLLTAITLSLALALDFIFLPTLLIMMENRKNAQPSNKAKSAGYGDVDAALVLVRASNSSNT